MTYKELKEKLEQKGITDEMTVVSMSFIGNIVHEDIDVIKSDKSFSVFGDHRRHDEK